MCFSLQQKGDPSSVTSDDMTPAKRGVAPLLGDLDQIVIDHIKGIRLAGGIVNHRIVISAALGIVKHNDKSLLAEHGGPVSLTRTWAESLLSRMGYIRRKETKAARKLPESFPEVKADFLQRIKSVVSQHNIPDDMIINFDQTGVPIVPVSNWTMDACGSKQVKLQNEN